MSPKDNLEEQEDIDPKLQWLGQDLMQGRPNDWVHGYVDSVQFSSGVFWITFIVTLTCFFIFFRRYDPAFSQAYRRQQAERNKPMKINGYKSKFDNLPFH